MAGKNNDCRQTIARTVYNIKYINFFDGPVNEWHCKGFVFRPILCHNKKRLCSKTCGCGIDDKARKNKAIKKKKTD